MIFDVSVFERENTEKKMLWMLFSGKFAPKITIEQERCA